MKKDQYFPHEVSMRQTNEVIHLIDEQGMTGYGLYWCLMEYLRTQDNYIGDLRALRALAFQYKTTTPRLMRILKNYGLFMVSDTTFRSRKLEAWMEPLEKKRRLKKKDYSLDDEEMTSQYTPHNSLKINDGVSTVKKSKVKESKVNSSSTEEEGSEAAEALSSLTKKHAWEAYVDDLNQEQEWKELMAMRSGLKKEFFTLYPRIVQCFKDHVRSIGKESTILSLGDAKHYFCFFITPGSATYTRLLNELKKQDEDDPYRFEYRDEETGQRMYCGVVIPDDAPPRPNEQSVWNPAVGKWTY